jgi:hypothetical protein
VCVWIEGNLLNQTIYSIDLPAFACEMTRKNMPRLLSLIHGNLSISLDTNFDTLGEREERERGGRKGI